MTDTNTPPEDPSLERASGPSTARREQLEAALADIAQDRERAYAALLGAAHPAVRPPWR